ncbi:MAG: four helix bundle protein [Dehalococcoidia bacterium]|nr:four helix bundle protein [Dehalococcoidia bacterium]
MKNPEPLIPKYGGWRKLKSYRMAQLVHEVTALFCEQYVEEESQACDRMLQAAETAAQKIAEGSQAGERSKKAELKLTRIARASLEDLRKTYVAYMRRAPLPVWDAEDPRSAELAVRRPKTLDDVAQWANWVGEQKGQDEPDAETVANGALALIAMALSLLDRQTSAQSRIVDQEARLAERLRQRRLADWPDW